MDVVVADRIQFAFTMMFHYLFPITTIGLAPFVAMYTFQAARGDVDAAKAAAFWTKIFAINFAIGVVTGIPMEFQFGTNWAAFSAASGSVIGQPLAIESVYAFFFESVFLGVLLYGKGRVSSALHSFSAFAVWIGSWMSGFFVITADAWMQHPVGSRVLPDGRVELTSVRAELFSTFAWWQFLHAICGAMVAGGFFVAGIGAYYLLSKREFDLGRRFVNAGTIVALVFSMLSIFPTGDGNSRNVTQFQPIKLAAMEGLFETTNGAPIAIIGMPDEHSHSLIDPVFVPNVLSFLAYGNFSANVKGLNAYAEVLWPPVELTYYAYHVMVGLGTIFVGVAALAALFLLRKTLFRTRPVLWLLLLTIPFPYIANEAGWVTTEVGRQPWIIYGIMRTSEGVSPTVVAGETIFTTIGFAGMYFLLGVLFLYLVLRQIAIGPP